MRASLRAWATVFAPLAGCARAPADPAVALVKEFRGAYPGEVREYELTAAPATPPMFDGRPLAVWAYNGQVP